MDCKIPDEMALEVMYGSNAFDTETGKKSTSNRSNSMVAEAMTTFGTGTAGRTVGDSVWKPMKSPSDDITFGNKTPYKMAKPDDGTINNITGGNNNTKLNDQSKEPPPDEETTGATNTNDPDNAVDSQQQIMERKQAVRIATFNEAAADDLKDNYEGMRTNFGEMYKELPSDISIQAYFTEQSIQGESSPHTPMSDCSEQSSPP